MFAVIFEVQPRPEQWENYLGTAKMLRPELEAVEGFVDNVRYRSLMREGLLLSLSSWRDEKALIRWRTLGPHHEAQEKGRTKILKDYHLRVGQVTLDTKLPEGHVLSEQRFDETETGEATSVTLITASWGSDLTKSAEPEDIGRYLGLDLKARGLVGWDVFDAVLTPGDLILLLSWQDNAVAKDHAEKVKLPGNARLRRVRVIRDYGMFDRREAPQYYPDVARG